MSGLAGKAGSTYSDLEQTPEWQTYAKDMQSAWSRASERRITPVEEFQTRELKNHPVNADYVFYPFSGPDVIYPQLFYPEGTTYVLAGLERPGSILGPEGYARETLAAQLNGIRRGSASLFDRTFFITDEMSNQLRGQLVDGVLPVALMLMTRMGNEVVNVRYVSVREDGELEGLQGPQDKRSASPDGFEATFRRQGSGQIRRLYYFRVDLGFALGQNGTFLKFLDRNGTPEVLIKSASFLLHSPNFARLREYLLSKASRITQDDTGVRYSTYLERQWKLRLFGHYSPPGPPFAHRYQEDLDAAFQPPAIPGKLGFAMGYGAHRHPSHLIVAEPLTAR